MYIEAYVEHDGYRYRFYSPGIPGVVDIEYQEWDDTKKAWTAHRGAAISVGADDVPAVCEALSMVSKQSRTP